MAEEPMEKEELFEDDTPRRSLADRMRDATKTLRERFEQGGTFLFAVFFVLGVFFGIAAKAVAARSILIGYWDYTVSSRDKTAVDLNAVQKKLLAEQAEEAKKQEEAAKAASDATGANGSNEEGAPANVDGSTSELPPPPPPPPAPPEVQQENE